MKHYAQIIKELRAKNLTDIKIKEAILEKSKKEINHFHAKFKSFKVKQEGENKTIEIEGYASTKDIDRYGDVVNPSAFEETIDLFMKNPVMLLQHDHNKRIGDFTKVEIDENGLYVKGDVKYTAGDDELFAKIENKSLKGFSIGYRVLEAEFKDITDEKGNVIDWIFVINKLDLVEISVVNVPANPYTLMKSLEDLATKSAEALSEVELEDENEEVEEEEEKSVDLDEGKVDDPEADNDGEDLDEEEDTEDSDDEAEAEEEEKELDEKEETDNITNEEEAPENPKEETDSEEAGADSKDFTTKTIEKIVEAKLSGNEKAFKTLVEKEVKNLSKHFEKQLGAVKSELEKELDAIAELVKEVKETEQALVDQIKGTIKGKGFIHVKTTTQKQEENNRLSFILSGIKQNKF